MWECFVHVNLKLPMRNQNSRFRADNLPKYSLVETATIVGVTGALRVLFARKELLRAYLSQGSWAQSSLPKNADGSHIWPRLFQTTQGRKQAYCVLRVASSKCTCISSLLTRPNLATSCRMSHT